MSVPAVTELPGLKVTPVATVTAPEIVPVPLRKVDEPVRLTSPVPVAEPVTLLTLSVPALTVVPPV